MPSGMGGIFRLKFVRENNGVYYFRITTKGFEKTVTFTDQTVNQVSVYTN